MRTARYGKYARVPRLSAMTVDIGSDVLTVPLMSALRDTGICPPDGDCDECLYPECPNKGRD